MTRSRNLADMNDSSPQVEGPSVQIKQEAN